MKLTTLEVLDVHQGLPALAHLLLTELDVKRAVLVAQTVRALTPTVEVVKATQHALINAHGESDRDSRGQGKVIVAGTPGAAKFQEALLELLVKEFDLDVRLIQVTAEELAKLDVTAFIQVTPIVEIQE